MINNEVATGEAQRHGIADLLVSRTDSRATILAANKAFERVSGFEWENLHKASYEFLRHPDMPKGIFWLIWDALKQKKPVGSFIKNRSHNGSYFWVFAFIAPQDDGFVSICIKPTPEAVKMVSKEYAALLKEEKEQGLTPEQSGEYFSNQIQDLGFRNYEHFSTMSASEQVQARHKELRLPTSELIKSLSEVSDSWNKVSVQCDLIKEAHEQISHTPTNLRVQAAHLNDRGIPLSVIASNFTFLASEIEAMMKMFLKQGAEVESQINQAAFSACLATSMEEVVGKLQNETVDMGNIDWEAEAKLMDTQKQARVDKAASTLSAARQEINSFSTLLEETARIMSGLSVAKVMCEIENAYVGANSSSGVTNIIGELAKFQTTARGCLFDIRLNLSQIAQSIKNVQSNWDAPGKKPAEALHRNPSPRSAKSIPQASL